MENEPAPPPESERYFNERAKRADKKSAMRFLDEAGTEAPQPGDELPEQSGE